MYNDFSYVSKYNKIFNIKKYVLIAVLFILGVVFFSVIISIVKKNNIFSNNSFKQYEKMMIKSAIDYVKRNNIVISDEIYLDISKLNIGVKKNCEEFSGVFINGNNEFKAYLLCDSYESQIIDNDSKYHLRGKDVLFISKDMPYVEQGIAENQEYNVKGDVGFDEGVYNLKYIIMKYDQIDDILERKVVVLNNEKIKDLMPRIELQGDVIEYIKIGQQYKDKGVVAYDLLDGDLSTNVLIRGNVEHNRDGEYLLDYLVTNSRGYADSITRKVVVLRNSGESMINFIISPSVLTNGDVTVYIDVISDDFDYVLLPDGSKSYSKKFSYKVNINGSYKFSCVEKNGKIISEEVVVDNINRSIPRGTCTAILYNDRTEVSVYSSSELPIRKYAYIFDDVRYDNIKNNSYKSLVKNPKVVKVVVENAVGTTIEMTCNIVDKSYREIYVDSNGKNCLEGFICYNQNDYYLESIPFCSTESCGPISTRGCSVTSMSTIISRYGVKSSNGQPYTPYTLTSEVYNKVCSSYCSGATATKNVVRLLGLSASKTYWGIGENKKKLINFLKNDTPVLIRVGPGAYTNSNGHLMAILGINSEGKVFLANTNKYGTISYYNGRYKWNTWVTIEEIESGAGNSDWFMAIGPAGMYNENS